MKTNPGCLAVIHTLNLTSLEFSLSKKISVFKERKAQLIHRPGIPDWSVFQIEAHPIETQGYSLND